MSVHVFTHNDSDGMSDVTVCDGTHHHHISLPDRECETEGPSLDRTEVCDGVCKPVDQRSAISGRLELLRQEEIEQNGKLLPTRFDISPKAELLMQGPLVGVCINRWYAKRNSQGETFCLTGGTHLTIDEYFDWWSGAGTGFYKTVTISVCACADGHKHRRLEDPRFLEIISQATHP